MTREWKRQGRWERDKEERKETEQEKDRGMTTKKRHTGHTHTEKDKKKRQCLWDSTALNWGISYSADKVENSTIFTAKPVIRK